MYYRGRGRGGPPVPMYRMTVSRNVHRYFTRNMQIHVQYNIRKYANVLKICKCFENESLALPIHFISVEGITIRMILRVGSSKLVTQ